MSAAGILLSTATVAYMQHSAFIQKHAADSRKKLVAEELNRSAIRTVDELLRLRALGLSSSDGTFAFNQRQSTLLRNAAFDYDLQTISIDQCNPLRMSDAVENSVF